MYNALFDPNDGFVHRKSVGLMPSQLLPVYKQGVVSRPALERIIVPFDANKHGVRAREIHKQVLHDNDSYFLQKTPGENDPYKIDILLSQSAIAGFIIYADITKSRRVIEWIAVAQEYRGLNYGKYLMQHNEDNARALKIKEITLISLYSAIDFYKKLGFIRKTKLRSYMFKVLSPDK
jgi:ribosomal protein S18 acetylase RimI-like enzyme